MAASVQLFDDLRQRLKGMPTSNIAGWRILSKVLFMLVDALKLTIVIDGGDIEKIKGGFRIKINSTEAAGDDPWTVSNAGSGNILVKGGTVGGMVVADGTFSGSGTVYVYVVVTATLTITEQFVNSFVLASAVLASAGAVPSDNRATGLYHIPIVRVEDGIVTNQYESTSLGFNVVDDGTLTSKGLGQYSR